MADKHEQVMEDNEPRFLSEVEVTVCPHEDVGEEIVENGREYAMVCYGCGEVGKSCGRR